jgi:hypothetical protein
VPAQVIPDGVGVPAGAAEEVLEAAGGGVAEALGQPPGVLAPDVEQQAVDVLQGAAARPGAAGVAAEELAHGGQLVGPAPDILDGR